VPGPSRQGSDISVVRLSRAIELLNHEPELVILSRGRRGRLSASPETLSLLERRGVPVVREKTDAALATYNRLAAERCRVAGLFHTTC
jgi:hypothetical protein